MFFLVKKTPQLYIYVEINIQNTKIINFSIAIKKTTEIYTYIIHVQKTFSQLKLNPQTKSDFDSKNHIVICPVLQRYIHVDYMPGFYVTGEIWNIFDNNKLRISAYLWRHLECINKTRDASVFLSIQRPTRLSWRGALRTILSPHIGAIRWTISSKFIVRGLPCLCRCHSWLSPLLWLQVWFIERQVCFTIDRTVYTFS